MMSDSNSLTSDWQEDKSLQECMMYMLKNEIMCDVTLRIGEDKIPIKAHKYMLSSRSPVFHTMFEGSMPEKGDIYIPEIEETTFRDLLKYIYSDEIAISNENVQEMLYAGDKYMLSGVRKECANILKKSASSEHATKVFQTACQFQLLDLKQESLEYIEKNAKKCLESKHALSLSKECLEQILKSDYLDCTETDICTFFLSWAKGQCKTENKEETGQNIREVAGHLLHLIRFPVIDMKYFSKEVSQTGLLSVDEVAGVYQAHFGVKNETFLSVNRGPVKKRPTITALRCDQITNTRTTDGIDALVFTSDTDIWLKGVNICSPYFMQQNYGYYTQQGTPFHASIYVLDDKDQVKATQTPPFYTGYQYNSSMCVNFAEAIRIWSGRPYTLKMDGMNCQSYYCQNCKESVVTEGVTLTFKDSPISTTGTNKNEGQFAGLLFSK